MTQLFVLTAQEVRLPGVVITEAGQDPGEILIRKAIAAKAANRACLPAFQAETYTLYTIRWAEPPPAPSARPSRSPPRKAKSSLCRKPFPACTSFRLISTGRILSVPGLWGAVRTACWAAGLFGTLTPTANG